MISLRDSPIYRQKSFDESKHPRDDSGKFGEGGAGSAAKEEKPSKPENKLPRYETGKRLTPEERKKVLESVRDVYKEVGLEKNELKGYQRDSGDPIYGYPHAPEHFVTSDITGAKVRHYITLPGGGKAHPSELFPNIKQSDIDKHYHEQEANKKRSEEMNRSRDLRIATSKGDANYQYNTTNRPLEGSFFAKHPDGRVVRVDGKDEEDIKYYAEQGFEPITPPVASAKSYRQKSKDSSGHEHAADSGQFTSGSGGTANPGKPESKLPRATKPKGPKPDDPIHGYLDAFNDPGETPATADDARTANKELKEEGSKYRIIPTGDGKWKTAHVKDLVNEYGEDWTVGVNALTGKIDLAGRYYLKEMQTLSGDKISRGYLAAFNDASGGQSTPEEAATANEEMAAEGSKFQIAFDKDYGLWVAKPREAKSVRRWVKSSGKPANNLPK